MNGNVCRTFQDNSNKNFARHLTIEGCLNTRKYGIRFPRVTKLTLKNDSMQSILSFFNGLNGFISFVQITDLEIKNDNISIVQLTKILSLLPNLESLTLLNIMPFQSKRNKNLLMSYNKLRKLIIDEDNCDIEHLQILIELFPCLQYLEISINENNLEEILRCLLLQFECLFSLFLLNINYDTIEKIQTLINKEPLIDNYTIERIHGGLYLWW